MDNSATVEVNWDAMREASHYRVYRSTGPYGTQRMRLFDWQTGTTFYDTMANTKSNYFYWIRSATSASGDQASDYSFHDIGWLLDTLPDLNGDLAIDMKDFAVLATCWKKNCYQSNGYKRRSKSVPSGGGFTAA